MKWNPHAQLGPDALGRYSYPGDSSNLLRARTVLVHDQVGPVEALRRSAQAFRRAWGETVIANIGLGIAFSLLYLPIFVVMIGAVAAAAAIRPSAAGSAGLLAGAGLLCLVYGLVLAIVQNTLQSIFLTACYQYAITGQVPAPFSRGNI